MKIRSLLLPLFLCVTFLHTQTPQGKKFGVGVILGDPTGLTSKFVLSSRNDLALSVGSSYFGSPRLNIDYLWRISSSRSSTINLYIGAGGSFGLGNANGFIYKSSNGRFYVRPVDEIGVGVRGIFGINANLTYDPVEFFFELGPMVGLIPGFGSTLDAGLGVRFYP